MTANQNSGGSGRIHLLNVKQAAEMLGDHPKTVYRLVSNGELPWVNTAPAGKRAKIRFREDRLTAYIEARERDLPSAKPRRRAA